MITNLLDWTICELPGSPTTALTGRYRTRRDQNLHRNFTVSRNDLAHLIPAASRDRRRRRRELPAESSPRTGREEKPT
jgi:hypothetical protein